MLVRGLRFERSFAVLLRIFRVTTSFLLELGHLLPPECEVFLAMLAGMVEAGATVVDSADPDTTFTTKTRFGTAGAKIVADAHRWFSDHTGGSGGPSSKASALTVAAVGTHSPDYDEDSVTPSSGRIVLPKLVLVLECWHMLTARPAFLRHVYAHFDATPDCAKVRVCARVCVWVRCPCVHGRCAGFHHPTAFAGATSRSQIFQRMLTAFEALLRNVLATQPGPTDPDYVEMNDVTEQERPSIDDDLFLKPTSGRFGFGRLMPKELDRVSTRFNMRPLQNLELVDTMPTKLSIATLPLLALQVRCCRCSVLEFGAHLPCCTVADTPSRPPPCCCSAW